MANHRIIANDAVCKLDQGSDLFRSLNTLRVEPNAPNPFVSTQTPAPAATQPTAPTTERQ